MEFPLPLDPFPRARAKTMFSPAKTTFGPKPPTSQLRSASHTYDLKGSNDVKEMKVDIVETGAQHSGPVDLFIKQLQVAYPYYKFPCKCVI